MLFGPLQVAVLKRVILKFFSRRRRGITRVGKTNALPVLRKNISLGLELDIVLRILEETASTEEGLLHKVSYIMRAGFELAEDSGRSTPSSVSRLALENFASGREPVPTQATCVLSNSARSSRDVPTIRRA